MVSNHQEPTQVIVVGTALPENIYTRRGVQRRIGGVAGIMAQHLTWMGHRPTLITPIAPGPEGKDLERLLAESRVNFIPVATDQKPAWADIYLNGAGKTRGNWPTYSWWDFKATATRILDTWVPQEPRYLVIDCSMDKVAIGELGRLAENRHWRLIINGTTPYRCKRLGSHNLQDRPKYAVTLNRQETDTVLQMCGSGQNRQAMRRTLQSRHALCTSDKEGWTLYSRDPDQRDVWKSTGQDLEIKTGNLPQMPPGGHAIGAGDAATAGLVDSFIRKVDPRNAINLAISERLEYNTA